MITAADAEFHPPDAADPTWGETNFFGFYSADEPLNVGIYTLFRPNLGVVLSTISMNSGDAIQPWRADFCDHQAQLPIPEPRSLRNYTLNNGLSVRPSWTTWSGRSPMTTARAPPSTSPTGR